MCFNEFKWTLDLVYFDEEFWIVFNLLFTMVELDLILLCYKFDKFENYKEKI